MLHFGLKNDSYVGAQTFMEITENNLVEVSFTKEDLLERILSPSNLNIAYKRVVQNRGSGGVDDLDTEDLLPYLTAHKNELIASLLDGSTVLILFVGSKSRRLMGRSVNLVFLPLLTD